MKVLLTGSSGFLGGHVAAALRRADASIVLSGVQRSSAGHDVLDEIIRVDLADTSATARALHGRQFDVCVHVAGATGGGPSALYRGNVASTASLMALAGDVQVATRFVLISSSSVYGAGLPTGDVDEESPLAPTSAYGESCVAREMVARLLAGDRGLDVTTVRVFNVVGPGQPAVMFVPAVARQIARIEKGLQPPEVVVGRLDTTRDYVDVRDVAAAIASVALSEHPLPPVLNLGCGTCWSGQQVLDLLLGAARVRPQVASRIDPSRRTDVLRLRNRSALASTSVAWAPEFDVARSLRDTVAYWRSVPVEALQ